NPLALSANRKYWEWSCSAESRRTSMQPRLCRQREGVCRQTVPRPLPIPSCVVSRAFSPIFLVCCPSEGRGQFEYDSTRGRTGAPHAPIEPNSFHLCICRGCNCFRTNVVRAFAVPNDDTVIALTG